VSTYARLGAWNSRFSYVYPMCSYFLMSNRNDDDDDDSDVRQYFNLTTCSLIRVSSRFHISDKIWQAFKAREFEVTLLMIIAYSIHRDVVTIVLLDARNSPSCQRGCDVVSQISVHNRRILCPIVLKHWMPVCRHAVLTGVVRRSEILRLRGGIFGWKLPSIFINKLNTLNEKYL